MNGTMLKCSLLAKHLFSLFSKFHFGETRVVKCGEKRRYDRLVCSLCSGQ